MHPDIRNPEVRDSCGYFCVGCVCCVFIASSVAYVDGVVKHQVVKMQNGWKKRGKRSSANQMAVQQHVTTRCI